jgi:hypothetical protein
MEVSMSYLAVIQELEQRQVLYEEAVARIRGVEIMKPRGLPTANPVSVAPIGEVPRVA